jgi:hypothetical protein
MISKSLADLLKLLECALYNDVFGESQMSKHTELVFLDALQNTSEHNDEELCSRGSSTSEVFFSTCRLPYQKAEEDSLYEILGLFRRVDELEVKLLAAESKIVLLERNLDSVRDRNDKLVDIHNTKIEAASMSSERIF